MKSKLTVVARVLLGLVFLASGVAGLMNKIPQPTDLPERLQTFNNGLMASGYFLPLLQLTQAVCGLLLVTGMFVPLALVVLAPVVVNIFFVHLFLEPNGLILACILGVLMIFLSFFSVPYSQTIKQLFKRK